MIVTYYIDLENIWQCSKQTNVETYSYFVQIYGELRAGASGQKLKTKWFSWSHSYSRVFQQLKQETYDPNGTFEAFHAKPVENRDRVKCIDAKYGKKCCIPKQELSILIFSE